MGRGWSCGALHPRVSPHQSVRETRAGSERNRSIYSTFIHLLCNLHGPVSGWHRRAPEKSHWTLLGMLRCLKKPPNPLSSPPGAIASRPLRSLRALITSHGDRGTGTSVIISPARGLPEWAQLQIPSLGLSLKKSRDCAPGRRIFSSFSYRRQAYAARRRGSLSFLVITSQPFGCFLSRFQR